MQPTRDFKVTTPNSPEGYTYTYDTVSGVFLGITVHQQLSAAATASLVNAIQPTFNLFIEWAGKVKGMEVVELVGKITFEKFWIKYNDRNRSSKKRSLKLWDKLDEANQIKAYYYYETYMRYKGNAEKKYCETYLASEPWNN